MASKARKLIEIRTVLDCIRKDFEYVEGPRTYGQDEKMNDFNDFTSNDQTAQRCLTLVANEASLTSNGVNAATPPAGMSKHIKWTIQSNVYQCLPH